MSVFAGWSPEAARLPDRLDDLHGPWQGVVVLPVHLTWHGLREFDVALEKPRLLGVIHSHERIAARKVVPAAGEPKIILP